MGPCWRRYNHDGYGQQADGSACARLGRGPPWPLLTGERGHYELAAGRDVRPYIQAMEEFASATGLLPEQVWDEPDKPERLMYLGKPTGAAMPLMWAHAEYIKLLRSARDGMVFDLIPEVAQHFRVGRQRSGMEVWKFNRQVREVPPGVALRILADRPFASALVPGRLERQYRHRLPRPPLSGSTMSILRFPRRRRRRSSSPSVGWTKTNGKARTSRSRSSGLSPGTGSGRKAHGRAAAYASSASGDAAGWAGGGHFLQHCFDIALMFG